MAAGPNPSYVGHYSNKDNMIPGVYNGMRMEVLDSGGEPLFFGNADVISETVLEVVRTSELLSQTIEENMPVCVRGFDPQRNRSVQLEGRLSRLSQDQDNAWLVREVVSRGAGAGRMFSRQSVRAQGWVLPEESTQWLECRVVNASAGGVCFRMTEPMEPDARLKIRFRLPEGREQPPLTIRIRRVSDRGGEFEYGSEFVDLSPEVDTIIARTVIRLQIMR